MSEYDWKAIDETEEKMGGTKRIDLDWALEKIKQREHNAAIDAVLEIIRVEHSVQTTPPVNKDIMALLGRIAGKISSLRRGESEASDGSSEV